MTKHTLRNIQKMRDKIEGLGLGGEDHELFVKGLIMAERDIQDLKTLDRIYQVYYQHDISLINDLMIEME